MDNRPTPPVQPEAAINAPRPPPLPPQSLTLGGDSGSGSQQSRGAQPLMELAMAKDEVKARLAPIPVYTVANPKNEFVLVAGEVGGEALTGGGWCS